MRLRLCQHRRDIGRAGAVTAAHPVVPQQPDVAELSDRLIGYFRNAVGIRQTARSQRSEDGLELIRVEADQVEVKTAEIELAELFCRGRIVEGGRLESRLLGRRIE